MSLASCTARREHGLFPHDDPLLTELVGTQGLQPFEKHLPGSCSPCESLPQGGWVTGDVAARNGLDLRMFYKDPKPGEQWGTIRGALRYGDGACIGNGFWTSVHGGAVSCCLLLRLCLGMEELLQVLFGFLSRFNACVRKTVNRCIVASSAPATRSKTQTSPCLLQIESALDEATAELAKIAWKPMVSTVDISFKIRKAVPTHTSLLVECRCAGALQGGTSKPPCSPPRCPAPGCTKSRC
jgi:hypothetical protein